MTCPRCGVKPKSIKTEPTTQGHARLLECAKHGLFWSLEVMWKWVTRRPGNGQATAGQPPGNGPPTAEQPPHNGGGVGGGLPSGQVPIRNLNPISSESPERGRARRKRRATIEYDPKFDAEWDLTAKTGSKDLAQQVWEQLGRPEFGASWKRWEACAEWKQDWYNYPHVVKWLRDGRYKQDPNAAKVKAVSANPRAAAAEREHEDREVARLFGVGR